MGMNLANISQRMKYPPVSSREYPAEGMHTLIRLLHSRPNVSSSFQGEFGAENTGKLIAAVQILSGRARAKMIKLSHAK